MRLIAFQIKNLYNACDEIFEIFGEHKKTAIWISIAVILGTPFILISSITSNMSRNQCNEMVEKYDSPISATQNNSSLWFQKGREQYRCREFFGDDYKDSLNSAIASAPNNPNIVQMFLDEAIRIRNIDSSNQTSSESNSNLDYSFFLLQRARDIQPNNYQVLIEIGKIQQFQFENIYQSDNPSSSSGNLFQEMNELINASISAYDSALKSKPNDFDALLYKGYAIIAKGDLFMKYFSVPRDEKPLTGEELKTLRIQQADIQYREAFNLLSQMGKKYPNAGDILLGKAISLTRLGSYKQACNEYRQALRIPQVRTELFKVKLREIQDNQNFSKTCSS